MGKGRRPGYWRLRLAYWLFCKLGDYIESHASINRSPEAIVAVQAPGLLMIDGTWMPDKQPGIQQ